MTTLVSTTGLAARIHSLPGREPFMLAADLAEFYETTVSALNQAVSRNPARFPEDFMFTLTEGEMEHLKSQNVISTKANRAFPAVFTHAGALMLSAVLKSSVAAEVSVSIHRAFAAMEKQALASAADLLLKLRTETLAKRPIRVLVQAGIAAGKDFDGIWRMGNYSRPKLAQALRECVGLGLIDALPAGTPAEQADLFGHA